VPVLSLGLFSSYSASHSIQEKVNQGNMQTLRQAKMAIEQSLALVDSSVTQLINAPSFNDAINHPLSQEDFVVYRELSANLSNLPYTRNGMNSVRLANFRYDWIIEGTGLGQLHNSAWREQMEAYARLPKTSEWIRADGSPLGRGEVGNDVRAKVSLVKKLPMLSNSQSPLALIVIDVYLDDINAEIARQMELGGLVLADSGNSVLLDRNRVLQGADEDKLRSLFDRLNAYDNAQPAYFQAELNETVDVVYLHSSYNKWKYLYVVSNREITRDARNIAAITLYLCLAMLVATTAVALFGTRSIYSPIRRLYEIAGKSGGSGDNHADELTMIEERMHTLARTGTELRGKLEAHTPQLKELFVLKLLQGKLRPKEIEQSLHTLQFVREWRRVCVMAVQIDTWANALYTERDRDLLMFAVSNIVGDTIDPASRLSPVVADQTQFTIVMSDAVDDAEWRATVKQWARQIKLRAAQYLKLKISIGVSRPYRQLKETSQAGREALEALRYRIRLGSGIVLLLDEVVPEDRESFAYPEQLQQTLIDAVKMADERWAAEALREWIAQVRDAAASHGEFQYALGKLLIGLIDAVQEGGTPIRSLFGGRSFLSELANLRSAEETELLFRESVVAPLIRNLETRRHSPDGSITQTVIGLIQQEFDTNLTLESCADQLNFHPSYVSKVFKKEIGMSFSDYLAQFRLHMSKQWLKETDMKIQDIAERLKYNSAAAFIRYFRKMEGITPGQYRDKIASQQLKKDE